MWERDQMGHGSRISFMVMDTKYSFSSSDNVCLVLLEVREFWLILVLALKTELLNCCNSQLRGREFFSLEIKMRVEQLHQTGAQCHRVKYCYQHTQLSSLQNVNKWTKQLLWITRLSTEPCQSARVSVEEFQHSSDSEPRLECRILPEPAEKC